jgi:hypothetical protein
MFDCASAGFFWLVLLEATQCISSKLLSFVIEAHAKF